MLGYSRAEMKLPVERVQRAEALVGSRDHSRRQG
jgi:hypothetical protein